MTALRWLFAWLFAPRPTASVCRHCQSRPAVAGTDTCANCWMDWQW